VNVQDKFIPVCRHIFGVEWAGMRVVVEVGAQVGGESVEGRLISLAMGMGVCSFRKS
jgi:hypothetical protein